MNPRANVRAIRSSLSGRAMLRRNDSATTAVRSSGSATRDLKRVPEATVPQAGSAFILPLPVELVLYILIGALALLTRLWDLSYRAQHHDESLHGYFSWRLFAGEGYLHDPMMHGPALFHSNAFAFFLVGDNDYATRLVPALFGVAVVLLPAMLRSPQFIGRWGALTCSTLLLLSPTIMFYTRFNRHDPYVLFATLVIIFSMIRFMASRETRWIILVWVTTGFLFTTLEVSFIIGFMLATFVGIIMAWQIDRILLGIGLFSAVVLAGVWIGLPRMGVSGLPGIPWEDPSSANIRAFAFNLAVHPITLTMLAIIVLTIGIMVARLNTIREGDTWLDGVLGSTPYDTTSRVMHDGLKDRRGMWYGILGGLTIFVTLYTTLFTNMAGLASGTAGALGYWLGQQDVQRGDQPWFYYLLILPQYELVAVLLTPVAAVITLKRIVPAIRAGVPVGRRNYIWGLFLWWTLVHLAVFSWAGEKMPWLSVHMALPMILLSGALIGDTIERLETRVESPNRQPAIALAVAVSIIGVAWFLLWSWGSAGPWTETAEGLMRNIRPEVADNPWLLYIPAVALLAALGAGIWRLGPRTAMSISGLALVGLLMLTQLHVSFRMSFYEGDIPRDMLIYVQSSPDVAQAVEDVGLLSRELEGGLDMQIWYDSGTSWPMQWYLRNYSNRRFFGTELSTVPVAPVVLISNENLTSENRALLSGYTGSEYAMRWWFPEEETYRRFAIAPELNKEWRQNYQTDAMGPFGFKDVAASVWRSIWSMRETEQQMQKFRMIAFRDLPAPIGSYNFHVFVRNDLMPAYNDIRY
jgi:predicted membrane-bound mannosyltransferase